MKKLKFTLALFIICLFTVFSCQTNDSALDEAPEITNIRSDSGGPVGEYNDDDPDDDDPGTLMMEISVKYTSGQDRELVRAAFGSGLNLQGYQQCPSDSKIEIWIIPFMTEQELIQILENIVYSDPDLETKPGTEGGGSGSGEPIAKVSVFKSILNGGSSSDPVARDMEVRELVDTFSFHYDNVCQ